MIRIVISPQFLFKINHDFCFNHSGQVTCRQATGGYFEFKNIPKEEECRQCLTKKSIARIVILPQSFFKLNYDFALITMVR